MLLDGNTCALSEKIQSLCKYNSWSCIKILFFLISELLINALISFLSPVMNIVASVYTIMYKFTLESIRGKNISAHWKNYLWLTRIRLKLFP